MQIRFIEGPAAGQVFECSTAEKYFLLGVGYERELRDVLTRVVKTGAVAYDIGSHAGFWVLWLSRLCGSSGRVFAFEPSTTNLQHLTGNLRRNGVLNALPVNLAASDSEAKVSLLEAGSESRIETRRTSSAQRSEVQAVRLDDFVYDQPNHAAPTLILFDVEGYAGHVLRGAQRILSETQPVVLLEVHDAAEANEISHVLSGRKYSISPIEKGAGFPRHLLATPP